MLQNKPKPEPVIIKNDTAIPQTYHGFLIPPNTTRIFDAGTVPRPPESVAAPKPEQPPEPEGIAALVLKSVKDIEAEIPTLSDDDLQELEKLEEAKGDKARKGVLAPIQTEQLERAKQAEFIKGLDGLTEPDLNELLTGYEEGSAEYGMIAERIEQLAVDASKGEGGE